MSNIREFLRTQKLKLTMRPYTINLNADIAYFTEFQNGFATALIPYYSGYYTSPLSHFEVSLINNSFKAVISTQYTCPSDVSWLNGYIIATNHNYPDSQKRVFLDKELKEVPDKQFYSIQKHENCFIVSRLVRSSKYNRCVYAHGILDKNLKELRFQSSGKDNLFGYFDHNFNIAVQAKYQKLGDFDKNGFAPFARDNVVGVVNMQGEEFIR